MLRNWNHALGHQQFFFTFFDWITHFIINWRVFSIWKCHFKSAWVSWNICFTALFHPVLFYFSELSWGTGKKLINILQCILIKCSFLDTPVEQDIFRLKYLTMNSHVWMANTNNLFHIELGKTVEVKRMIEETATTEIILKHSGKILQLSQYCLTFF